MKLQQLSSMCLQVDNLRTNHRGTFVLKDNTFRWLTKLSVDPPPAPGAAAPRAVASVSELARDYLVLPCALVRVVGCGIAKETFLAAGTCCKGPAWCNRRTTMCMQSAPSLAEAESCSVLCLPECQCCNVKLRQPI